MRRALLLLGGHLCTAPRPQKEAVTLARSGFHVLLAGNRLRSEWDGLDELVLADMQRRASDRGRIEWKTTVDVASTGRRAWMARARTRFGREWVARTGRFHPDSLGYGVRRIARFAAAYRANLIISHHESALWVVRRMLERGSNAALGVDFEDWFSEDLPESAWRGRPRAWLRETEGLLARRCDYRLCPSHAMAEAMRRELGAPAPEVIYNAFPRADATAPGPINSPPRLCWFSQTVGPGRGLEDLAGALARLVSEPWQLRLLGAADACAKAAILDSLPAHRREDVHFVGMVPNGELPRRLAECDIGLALERRTPRNRDLTVTNKVFQYLAAGLAVVATDTAGQREVLAQAPGAAIFCEPGCAVSLSEAIRGPLTNQVELARARASAHRAAASQLNWEVQEPRLTRLAERVVAMRASSGVLR